MKHVLVSLLLLAPLAYFPCRSTPPSDPIRAWHRKDETEPLSRVETFPVPGRPDLVVALCDYQREWSGFFGVYAIQDGGVSWMAINELDEQSVHRVRGRLLGGFKNPIIEVFGVTHRGNGNLYLFELRDRRLLPLLETRAVDFSPDVFMFQGGCLTAEYRDLNGDGVDDVILEGIVEEWEEKADKIVHREPRRQVFVWDPDLGRFSEDVSSRVGVAESFD